VTQWLQRHQRSTGHPVAPAQALAMVLLRDQTPPDPRTVFAWLRDGWPDTPSILNPESQGAATTAIIQGGAIGFLHVPASVPEADLAAPVATAWHWNGAEHAVKSHQSHVICYASSTDLSPIELRLLHTRFVAAIAASTAASAVYVGCAMLLRESGAWILEAREANWEALPILLWVGFNPVKHDGLISAYTTGLRDFDLLEFEVHQSTRPALELLNRLADIAYYAVTTGIQIGDGHTVGASEQEHIEVHHATSAFLPDSTVALLSL
jgi:hypothetical protein